MALAIEYKWEKDGTVRKSYLNGIKPVKVAKPKPPKIQPTPAAATVRKEDLERTLYSSNFSEIRKGAVDDLAKILFPPPSLRAMAKKGFFDPKYDYLAWALDVKKGQERINFERGMMSLWDRKVRLTSGDERVLAQGKRNEVSSSEGYHYADSERMGLSSFRNRYFASNLERVRSDYLKKEFAGVPDSFKNKMASLLDPEILLSYSVQELIPGQYNALSRIFLYDKFLSSAGTDYLSYFPALHDPRFSYGPFQLTPIAVEEVDGFSAKCPRASVPPTLLHKWGMDDHAKAAIAFALVNINRAAIELGKSGGTARLEKMVDSLSESPQGRRKLKIFMTGFIGAMHNKPSDARRALVQFSRYGDMENPHTSYLSFLQRPGIDPNLPKYYRKSAEIYITLGGGNYEQLMSKYAGKAD